MRERWSAPEKGWPTFGPDGKVVKERPLRGCGLRHTGPCPVEAVERFDESELIDKGTFRRTCISEREPLRNQCLACLDGEPERCEAFDE